MRILVTGATSLLGRHLALALQARGDEVTVFQRGASGLDVTERRGSVTDPTAVAGAVAGVDAVVHLAARVAATGPWDAFVATNVTGTETVIAAARADGHIDSEEQQALEQWLRRIPDDPGGLLRRKFLYQYRQRGSRQGGSGQDW